MTNVSRQQVEQLLQWGMVAIPTPPGEKNPKRAGWQNTRMADVRLAAWTGEQGVGVNTGEPSGWVVLDLDNPEAATLWRKRLGDELWYDAPRSLSSKGQHLWFRVSEPWQPFTQENDPEAKRVGAKYDLLGDGRFVMAPPSLHPSGKRYKWAKRPYDGSPSAPAALRRESVASGAAAPSSGALQRGSGGGGRTRSLASQLLDNPPDEGGRNSWLTQVLGHFAKEVRFEDAFYALARALNRSLPTPLDGAEVTKTAESIWRSEEENHGGEPKQRTGWLAGAVDHLVVLAQVTKDGQPVVMETSDFDIQVLGKYADEQHRMFYRLALHSQLTEEVRYLVEAASVFATGRTADPWLVGRELNLWPVNGDIGAKQPMPRRLAQYLSSQEAPLLQVAPHMGWHEEAQGFVCEEGLIGPDGLDPQGGWLPDPAILLRDKHINRYGFEHSWEEAQRVLREVLTFQDDTVTSVFGSWWAAVLIKPLLMAKVAGFPFVAIEAMSGSGKSEGFFNLMVGLNGAMRDKGSYTQATFRDALASNRSGIVWIDDPDDPTQYYGMIRTATNEAAWSKKAADNTATTSVHLVAPVLLTAEALPRINDERALLDRLIQIDVPSASGRESMHGRGSQWEDVLALRAEHPDLWKLSGWYVQQALRHGPGLVEQWDELRNGGSGRHADKMCVLRLGARLLAKMTDSPWHVEIVDEWTGQQEAPNSDYLTNRILPDLLQKAGWPTSPHGQQPVFINDETDIVWYWPKGVSVAWTDMHRHSEPRIKSFGEEATIDRHRKATGVTAADRKIFDLGKAEFKRLKAGFYPLPPALSAEVIERSRGR